MEGPYMTALNHPCRRGGRSSRYGFGGGDRSDGDSDRRGQRRPEHLYDKNGLSPLVHALYRGDADLGEIGP